MKNVELTTLLAGWFLNGYFLTPEDIADDSNYNSTSTSAATTTNIGDDKLWRKKAPNNILEYTLLRKILQLALVNRDINLSTIGLQVCGVYII